MAFQGSLRELPLPDIIQLVSVSGKTGVFELRNGPQLGEIFLRDGQIVHAISGSLAGEEAVYELAVWSEGDFVFLPGKEAPRLTIKRSNTNLLMEAARRLDEWQVLSKRIPSTHLVPTFTYQAKKTSVSLTPAEWNLIARIDERRSIEEIALALGESPFEVSKTLYGLITSGLVVLEEALRGLGMERVAAWSPPQVRQVLGSIADAAGTVLGSAAGNTDLEAALRLSQAEADAGRPYDAVVDLVRATFKMARSAAAADGVQALRERIARLLAR